MIKIVNFDAHKTAGVNVSEVIKIHEQFIKVELHYKIYALHGHFWINFVDENYVFQIVTSCFCKAEKIQLKICIWLEIFIKFLLNLLQLYNNITLNIKKKKKNIDQIQSFTFRTTQETSRGLLGFIFLN